MINIIDFFLNIDEYLISLVQVYGYYVYLILFAIIFLETGFVITPFLPGDSMIFVAGTLSAQGVLNPYMLFIIISLAAILGDTLNYWIGKYIGERVFHKYINEKYLDKTKEFYEKHGAKTIVIARYIPIVRTFAPFVAGVGKMNYLKFLIYNVVGGITWVAIFVFGGYFFGNIPFVRENLTFVVLAIILTSFIPPVIGWLRQRRKDKNLKN